MKRLMCGLLTILFSFQVFAGAGEVKHTLAAIRNQIEHGKAVTVNDRDIYHPANELLVLSTMQEWIDESKISIRLQAVTITGRLAFLTSSAKSRKQALNILFKACEDKDACIGAIALQYLKQVKWQYYMPVHKDTIGLFLNDSQPSLDDYLHMAGYMYAFNQMDTIKNLIASGNLNSRQIWKAHLALARLGNKQSIDECVKIASAMPFDESYINDILPGLIYTRQKACTDLLVGLLMKSNKVIASAKRNRIKLISYHYSIVEALATVIDGLPVKMGLGGELVTPTSEDPMQSAIKWFELNDNYWFKGEKRAVNTTSTVNYCNVIPKQAVK